MQINSKNITANENNKKNIQRRTESGVTETRHI